jgi:hypothetical protein
VAAAVVALVEDAAVAVVALVEVAVEALVVDLVAVEALVEVVLPADLPGSLWNSFPSLRSSNLTQVASRTPHSTHPLSFISFHKRLTFVSIE